jgi:TetR/AcrR family transcriptional regulator, tetracycline repressor protein
VPEQDAPRRVGRPRRLSREQLLDAALALIDEHGLDRLTMEQVAASLGVGTSTVYGYVATRQDLVDAVLDHVVSVAEMSLMERMPWQQAARTFMGGFRLALIAHPNLASRWATHEVITPRTVQRAYQLLEVMVDDGFTVADATAAYLTLHNFTLGQALWELSRLRAEGARAYGNHLRAAAGAAGWRPELLLGVPEYAARTSAAEHFERGLGLVLAGIEAERAPLANARRRGRA